MPLQHILSMQFIVFAGGIVFIKVGSRESCRGLGFQKVKRDAARSQERVIQNWMNTKCK